MFSSNRWAQSMIDLFHFVLWMIACFVCLFVVCFFVKLVKLDLCHVVYTGFHWRYANMLTRKKRKGRLLIFSSNKFNLLITSLRYLSWQCDLGQELCITRWLHYQGVSYHEPVVSTTFFFICINQNFCKY